VSWPLVLLNDLSEKIDYGLTASALDNPSGPRFLRITDLQNDSVNWQKVPSCDCSQKDIKQYCLKKGDLVFARTGATTGKSYLLNDMPENSVFASYLIRVRPNSKVNPQFLSFFFKSPKYWQQISVMANGAAQPGVNSTKLRDLEIPLPPLSEQIRIATILDKADNLCRKRQQAIQLADQFLRSVFLDLFGDPLNPNVSTVTLGELAELIMGQSPSGSSYNESGNGSPLINGPVEFGKYSPTERQWTTSPSKYAKAGDILFCVRGATAGKLNIADKEYCIGRGVAAIRPKNIKTAKFIFKVLDLSYDFFQKAGVGSTFINISKEQLLEFRLPNSSEIEMDEFFTISEYVESIKGNGEQFLESSNNEFNSLSQKAFAGEL